MRNKKFAAFVLAVVMGTSLLSSNIFAADAGDLDFNDIKSIELNNMDGATTAITSSTSIGYYAGETFSIKDVVDAEIPTSSSLTIAYYGRPAKGAPLEIKGSYSYNLPYTFTSPEYLYLGVTEISINTTSGGSIVSSSAITLTRYLEAFRQGFFKVGSSNMSIAPAGDKTFNVTYTVPANTNSVDFNFTQLFGAVSLYESNANFYYDKGADLWATGDDDRHHRKLFFNDSITSNATAGTIKTTFRYEDRYKDNNDYIYNITINRPAATTTIPTTGGWTTSGESSKIYAGVSSGSNVTKVADSMDKFVTDRLLSNSDIVLALKSGVNSANLSQDVVASLIQNKKTLYVTKEGVTVAITPDAMENAGLNKGKLEITLKPYTQNDIASISKMDAVNKDLFKMFMDVKIKVNNVEVKNYPTPLLLSFDTAKLTLTDAQKAMLTGVRIVDGNTFNQLGGNLNGKKFEFYTSSLSNYGIIVSDSLVKIATTVGKTAYTLNGKTLTSDVAPTNMNGSVMVPIRFVAEAFGAEIKWDDSSKTVGIMLGSQDMKLKIGQKLAGMNVAPTIVDDRTLVPLRYVSETLGANVVWDDATKTVTIAR